MKKVLEFFKNERKRLNLCVWLLAVLVGGVCLWGYAQGENPLHMRVDDGIEQIDLDTIYLKGSGVEVDFSKVILSDHKETRKLIVSTQKGTVTTELTDRLIKQLDFDFLKKRK